MKNGLKLAVFSCLIMAGCLASCKLPGLETGTLSLTLSSGLQDKKTIVPPFDMSIVSYDLSGSGPDADVFSQTGVIGSTITETHMRAGMWTINVDAYNAAHQPIGEGTTEVSIEAGGVAQASVTVFPLDGTGTLLISVSWPADALLIAEVSGSLAAMNGTPQSIPFKVGENPATYAFSSQSAGYYALTLQLFDNAALRWGSFEAVRIIKDQTTTASFILTPQDLQ